MKELIQGASAAFVLKLIAAGAQFLLTVYVTRTLGAAKGGIFFLVLTVLLVASIVGRAGLDNTLLRFTSGAVGLDRWEEVKGVYRKGMGTAIVASVSALIVLAAGSEFLAVHLFSKPELTVPLRVGTLALIPLVLGLLHAELLKALKKIPGSVFVQGIGVPGITLAVFAVIAHRWEVLGAVWSYVAATWLTFAIGFYWWRKATPRLKTVHGSFPTRELYRSSRPLFLVASMTFIMGYTGTMFLGIWGTSAEVGVFTAAIRTALLISLVLIAVNAIAAPKFAELYRKGDIDALASLARNATILVSALAAPVFLVFLVWSNEVMTLFGPEFERGGTALAILAAGQYVNVLTGSVAYLLMMTGNEHLVRNNMAFAALLNLILNYLLIRSHGLLGAAIGTAIAISLLNLGAMYLARTRLGIMTVPIGPARRV